MKYKILFLLLFLSFSFQNLYASEIIEITHEESPTAWLIEEHSLPIVSIKLIFKNTGSAYDPANKLGLAQFAVSMLDEGAGEYSSLAYKRRLEELAIRLRISVDRDHTYITIKSLKENLNEALRLLMLAINSPHIEQAAVERVRKQILISIETDAEDPNRLAGQLWNMQAYKEHPYANPLNGTEQTVNNITHDDIRAFIKRSFNKNIMLTSIVGALTEKEAKTLVKNYLGMLPNIDDLKTEIADVSSLPLGSYQFIEKPNPQSVVIFGSEGVTYQDEDFYPAYLLNHILGGGSFESRLMQQIREERGLTYSVYSHLSINKHSKLLKGSLGTKNSSLEEALALLKEIFAEIQENGVTEVELEAAKQYLIGSYPLRFDTNSKLADGLAFIQLENLGKDFINKRNTYVRNVTLQQVNKAAEKLLNPDNLIITIVGGKN
jgi:zinc protease